MDGLSPPESRPINRDLGGPERYRFEPLVQQCSEADRPARIAETTRAGLLYCGGFVAKAIDFDGNSWVSSHRGQSRLHFRNKKNAEIGFAFRRLLSDYSCNHLKELADGSLDHEMFSTKFFLVYKDGGLSSEDQCDQLVS